MCQLIESIRVENRQLKNIAYHNERFNFSRKSLFGIEDCTDLADIIKLPDDLDDQLYKCRVVYSKNISPIEFLPYQFRKIQTLKLVHANSISYDHKFLERNPFDELKSGISEDEILIVKDGFITDTSFSNIVFYDGSRWICPSSFLLNGTMRRYLLDTKKIFSEQIRFDDIRKFRSAKMINAMLDLENSPVIEINNIH